MEKTFLILFLLISLCKCELKTYSHLNNESNLYFVLTSFRHGARTPLIKKDSFQNKIKYLGRLTAYGRLQHLIIGRKYRKRYYNFLNLNKSENFDKEQLLVKSSDIGRTLISTQKQVEGLFNTTKNNGNIKIVSIIKNVMNLYIFNKSEVQKVYNSMAYCNRLRKLSAKTNKNKKEVDIKNHFRNIIVPEFKRCYNHTNFGQKGDFCESIISAYFDYQYNNQTKNSIGKCGNKTAKLFYDYCVKLYDSYRGWNEKEAYIFVIFFKSIYNYMKGAIDGKSKLKMIMLGGHDSTVFPLMNFLHGLKIIIEQNIHIMLIILFLN